MKDNWKTALVLIGVVIVTLALWWWDAHRIDREVFETSSAKQNTLYKNALRTFREVCSNRKGEELYQFCSRQAGFVEGFPECDARCKVYIRRYLPRATR